LILELLNKIADGLFYHSSFISFDTATITSLDVWTQHC